MTLHLHPRKTLLFGGSAKIVNLTSIPVGQCTAAAWSRQSAIHTSPNAEAAAIRRMSAAIFGQFRPP